MGPGCRRQGRSPARSWHASHLATPAREMRRPQGPLRRRCKVKTLLLDGDHRGDTPDGAAKARPTPRRSDAPGHGGPVAHAALSAGSGACRAPAARQRLRRRRRPRCRGNPSGHPAAQAVGVTVPGRGVARAHRLLPFDLGPLGLPQPARCRASVRSAATAQTARPIQDSRGSAGARGTPMQVVPGGPAVGARPACDRVTEVHIAVSAHRFSLHRGVGGKLGTGRFISRANLLRC